MGALFDLVINFLTGIVGLIQNSWLFDFVGLTMLYGVVIFIQNIIRR
jgi:hypothetical protein